MQVFICYLREGVGDGGVGGEGAMYDRAAIKREGAGGRESGGGGRESTHTRTHALSLIHIQTCLLTSKKNR